jgi:eukaryotic-like serine/threonine-protein kinase
VQRGQIDVGQIVAGKYELVRLLGRGAMGEVWLASHASLGGQFAIKLVRPEAQDADESALARFQQEAQVSAKLSRKTRHIVSVSDHGEDHGLAYLVMELLEGESLETRIDRGDRLDVAEAIAIITQIARALGQAHAEQIVHRDLKPANVFLTKDEDGRLVVKLLDFGIARATRPGGARSPFSTGKDMVLGTPSYMSPEQARGLPSLDHRCDLWALAVVAYEALAQAIPWPGTSIEDIFLSICTHEWTPLLVRRPDLPPELEGFFARAFAEELGERFRSAAELAEAFVAAADPSGAGGFRASAPSSPEMQAPRTPPEAIERGGRELDRTVEELGVELREPTLQLRKRRSGGWLIAALLGIATIGVVALAVVAFREPEKAKLQSPPPEPSATSVERGTVPPPEPTTTATTTTTALAPAQASATSTAKGTSRPATRPVATAQGPQTTAAPASSAPPVVTAAPPPPPPPAAPQPVAAPPATPATAKPPPDKSQVF